MRIAICDDDEMCRTLLTAHLNKYITTHENREISYSVFSGAEELLIARETQGSFDVYILDVLMPDTNGIELGEKLRRNKDDGIIIYLTSSKDYAIDSYAVKASGYLLKPVVSDALASTLEEAYHTVINKEKKGILVKTKSGLIRISLDSILYVELCRRTAVYHLTNGKTETSTTLRVPFAEAMQELLDDKCFKICSQSTIVNLSHVTRIGETQVTFSGGHDEYFSKKICQTIRSHWMEFYKMNE